ncbi:MAG: flagellin [Nitrospirae bacterium]|nr:flagellin [Nitrospirota bacterium]
MALVVNTNIYSLNAQRNLAKTGMDLGTSLQRISSGLRVNSAKDDAAGLGIADRMTTQVRGLGAAIRNANDGISVSQVAEGALQEVNNSLQRIRELSVQSANDTNSAADRASLQAEVSQLQAEITRIADQTEFNGKKVLDGTFVNAKFQIGIRADQTISVSIANTKANAIGNYSTTSDNATAGAATVGGIAVAATAAATSPVNNVNAQTLTISGSSGQTTVAVGAGDKASAIATAINAVEGTTNVTATARTTATMGSFNTTGTTTFDLLGDNTTAVSISANITATGTQAGLQPLIDAINAQKTTTGISAAYGTVAGTIALTHDTGGDIKIQNFTNGVATVAITGGVGAAVTLTSGGAADSTTVGGLVTLSSSKSFTASSSVALGAGSLFNVAAATAQTGTLSAVADLTIATQTGANSALSVVDGALKLLNSIRGDLGAVQSRFESTIGNLSSVEENVTSARSRVLDADFAQETANLTRAQILRQSGIAILAQANAIPQQVLALLKG